MLLLVASASRSYRGVAITGPSLLDNGVTGESLEENLQHLWPWRGNLQNRALVGSKLTHQILMPILEHFPKK